MSEIGLDFPASGDCPPLVTIAMPIYNAGAYLRLAVASIIQQTFRDWELIIIDDGSTDESALSIQAIPDARIKVLRDESNRGLAARLNEAIEMARGRYFARMDHDDICYPERLARQVAALESDPRLDLVGVRCMAIDSDNASVGVLPYALSHDEICARPWRSFHLAHPTWMGRTAWFRRHRYAAPGPYYCEDQELLLRSYRDSRFSTIPEILFAYRVRNRISWRKEMRARRTLFGVQFGHFLETRQIHFGGLAFAVFTARVVKDSFDTLAQNFGRPAFHRHRLVPAGKGEEARWGHILREVDLVAR